MMTGHFKHPKPHADYGHVFRQQWKRLRFIRGDVAEFGVYEGGTTRQLAEITGRTVFAFDTFYGMPAKDFDPALDRDAPGSFTPHVSDGDALFEDCPTIFPVAGRFADTLPAIKLPRRLVLVYIDCDLYASAKQVYDWLPDNLANGAVIVLDDYATHPGINKATDEFLAQWKDDATFFRLEPVGGYIDWRHKP